MKKSYLYFITMHTGYCGSTGHDVILLDTLDHEDANSNEVVYEMAYQHAEAYGYDWGICGDCEGCDSGGDCEEPIENESIEGYVTIYIPAVHDSLRSGGGSFLSEYPNAVYDTEEHAYYVI